MSSEKWIQQSAEVEVGYRREQVFYDKFLCDKFYLLVCTIDILHTLDKRISFSKIEAKNIPAVTPI
jgi:hypothetical protein